MLEKLCANRVSMNRRPCCCAANFSFRIKTSILVIPYNWICCMCRHVTLFWMAPIPWRNAKVSVVVVFARILFVYFSRVGKAIRCTIYKAVPMHMEMPWRAICIPTRQCTNFFSTGTCTAVSVLRFFCSQFILIFFFRLFSLQHLNLLAFRRTFNSVTSSIASTNKVS